MFTPTHLSGTGAGSWLGREPVKYESLPASRHQREGDAPVRSWVEVPKEVEYVAS